MSTSPTAIRSRPAFVLAMLFIVYVFNFVDRQILSILAKPIQAELHLSDARMGVLGGFAIAVLFAIFGVPLAWLADRRGRSRVIAAALAVWSVFTVLSGMAQGFGQLFAARLGVGIGEAGGVAPSHALISASFPPKRRARALALYSLGIPVGSATGILVGAAIASRVDWRTAFLVVGLAGLLFALPFRLLVRDPVKAVELSSAPRFGVVARQLAAKPAFWLLSLGAAAGSTVGYGLAFWLPSLLGRSFGLKLTDAAHFIAALLLIGGVAGILLGGVLADKLGKADKAFYGWLPAIGYLACVPLYAGGIEAPSVGYGFALFLLPTLFSYLWLGPVIAAVQHLVEPGSRATASALFLLINNLIGLGAGAPLIGALSTALAPSYGTEALRYAMLITVGLYLLASLLMALAGPALRRGWIDEA
jgi:MFS family permease